MDSYLHKKGHFFYQKYQKRKVEIGQNTTQHSRKSSAYEQSTRSTMNDTQKFYADSWQFLAKAQILAMQGKRAMVIDEMPRYLKQAMRLQFNSLAYHFASYLHYFYSSYPSEKAKMEKYLKLREKYHDLCSIEEITQIAYLRFIGPINSTRAPSQETLQELSQVCNTIEPYLSHMNAPISQSIYTLLNVEAFYTNQLDRQVLYC